MAIKEVNIESFHALQLVSAALRQFEAFFQPFIGNAADKLAAGLLAVTYLIIQVPAPDQENDNNNDRDIIDLQLLQPDKSAEVHHVSEEHSEAQKPQEDDQKRTAEEDPHGPSNRRQAEFDPSACLLQDLRPVNDQRFPLTLFPYFLFPFIHHATPIIPSCHDGVG